MNTGVYNQLQKYVINIAYLLNLLDEEFINYHKNPSDHISYMGSLNKLNEYKERKLKLKINE